jgi:DedD protein
MSRSREPSYYEVALTNRQVMVAFAVLLACVLGAFLAGVWVGRSAEPPGLEMASAATPAEPEKAAAPSLDLFAGEDPQAPGGGREQTLDPSPRPGTRLAEDFGATGEGVPAADAMPAAAETAGSPEGKADEARAAAPAGPANGTRPPGWRQRQRVAREAERLSQEFERETATPPPVPDRAPQAGGAASPAEPTEPAPRRSPAPAAAPGGDVALVVQVLSSRDQAKARETLSLLQDGGYPATLSTLEQADQVLYRVRLGPYRDRPSAERAADEVRRKFKLDTWITSE